MARRTGSTAEDTRARLHDAATRLFARHGFAAVSMRQIAAEMGVQAGTLYLYTPDKQALLAELMQQHLQALMAALAALPALDDPLARLDQFARFHVTWHIDRPEAVVIAYMELRNLTPDNFARIEAGRRAYENALEAILRDGAARGVMAVPDARLATMALIALLTGVTQWYREGGRLSRAEVAAIYAGMAVRAVLPPAG